MKRPWYATNARDLLQARQQGFAPAGPVVVSMVGGDFADVAERTLHVRDDMPIERLDWRMLVDLQVWLWANAGVALDRLMQVVDGIARARPRGFALQFEHGGQAHGIDFGVGVHVPAVLNLPAVHEFLWAPTTINGTRLEQQLRRAALARHPRRTVL
jgi:hypothetical protein